MDCRILAVRKRNKNHVFFIYVENEKIFVINTEAIMGMVACARGRSHKVNMEAGICAAQQVSDHFSKYKQRLK